MATTTAPSALGIDADQAVWVGAPDEVCHDQSRARGVQAMFTAEIGYPAMLARLGRGLPGGSLPELARPGAHTFVWEERGEILFSCQTSDPRRSARPEAAGGESGLHPAAGG